jgi:hypothetical protein
MSVEKSVVWNWEDPINITANLTTTIKWQPNTFGGSATNNFSCNIWMMRQDSSSDSQVFVWAPVLLAGTVTDALKAQCSDSNLDLSQPTRMSSTTRYFGRQRWTTWISTSLSWEAINWLGNPAVPTQVLLGLRTISGDTRRDSQFMPPKM